MRGCFVIVLVSVELLAASANAGVRTTKHNLSVSGPGAIRAQTETQTCIFCHTPHNASQTQGLLWNRADSTATYIPYQSPTLGASVGQPTHASKLCLSCHDGTVALGALLSEPTEVGFVGGVRFMPPGPAQLGTDLTDDHPVSFHYDAALVAQNFELADPNTLTAAVRLDPFGQMQCTSCHNPHEEGFGKFLVASTRGSDLCLVCHKKSSWPASSHATSTATWNGTPPDPWPYTDYTTVADNACASCHHTHSADSTAWILNRGVEEDNCLVCHNSQVAATDIQSQLTAPYHHPVELTADVHTPNENAALPMPEHVECTDCHNPHALTGAAAVPPLAGGALREVPGVDQAGNMVTGATYQYEVCYKCHGDFPVSNPPVSRQIPQNSKRLQFDVVNPSYHPVAALGKNVDVPSLLAPYTEASLIYCTDCHASEGGPGAGGSGPAGPHGSAYPNILERQYNLLDGVSYNPILYDLCFKCHSEPSVLSDESFKEHNRHLQVVKAPCSVCHDPHGISATQGSSTNNSNLVNFDISVVAPDPLTGLLEFQDLGPFTGRCYLSCHNHPHSPGSY